VKIIDLTHTITENMPVYPGTERPSLKPTNTYEVDGFKETLISMFSHTGTHIDPPAHIIRDGKTLDSFDASSFVGKALVINCMDIQDGEEIKMEHIAPYKETLKKVDFLLFNTGWDKKWGKDDYFGNYPCISDEVLDFIIDGEYKGIGFDVIGLDPIGDASLKRHNKLFKSREIINIENLKSLDKCGKEPFTFICLPIKISNSDGAPARAIAIIDA
jgi:kynurenine formamidase